ncbi:MAG: DUF475 domain-containing protein [Thaumarchaeota archaeon]|nr:DUF475 domain-containing protein [Nitrososphaerota archaeon]MCL5318736.1 DUF475 domain-containing protein [Nitrososphaerota archaeon]
MDFILLDILTIVGLSLFEIVSSIDNAVINADVLATVSKKARRWFLTWGIFSAVFLMRGALPLLIVYSLNPSLSLQETAARAFSSDPAIIAAVEESAPPLLMAGGVFLVFLFFHWIFLEPKHYGLIGEAYIHKKGVWFYAVVSIMLTLLIWFSIQADPLVAFGASVGSSIFFITHGFRQNAEQRERELLGNRNMSDVSKILYLEVIDASFSIDGVVGAFAFTFSILFILIGNGIGAIAVRNITIRNIENVKKYKYLKNGAMYSIAFLGTVMVANSFRIKLPEWISPIATIVVMAYFFQKSRSELKKYKEPSSDASSKSH